MCAHLAHPARNPLRFVPAPLPRRFLLGKVLMAPNTVLEMEGGEEGQQEGAGEEGARGLPKLWAAAVAAGAAAASGLPAQHTPSR